ncbi:MAG TPA: hypothetical protein VN408_35815 [Actinoplanes sp.]|nr:hypothetical protein [Actinoplanes sp.]
MSVSAALTPPRMRAAMLQRSLREHPGPAVAALVGLLAAGWLIHYASYGDRHTLSIMVGTWVLGWIVLPLMLGGGRGRVRPSHLRLEPVGAVPATAGLLLASAVGVGPLVSLVALVSLPVHAARYGAGGVLVAGFGALLLWLTGLIGSAFALEAIGHAGGPVGAILTGVFTGTVMGVFGSVWAVAPWITVLLAGTPAHIVRWLPWFPGSWPLSAVAGPSGRGLWMITGLVLITAVFAAAYLTLVRRTLAMGSSRRPRRSLSGRAGVWGPGPVWAVTGRELRTWVRHPLRLQYLAFAVVYGTLLAGLPLLAGADLLVPWAGAFAALWAASMSAGLIGLDGTALWMVFGTPGGERAEVHGRALAWLLLVTPVAVLLTVAGMLLAPAVDPLPALAVLPAVLGAGAAVPVWVSLLRIRPVPDVRHPTAADNPTDMISVLVAAAAGVLAAAGPLAWLIWGPAGSGAVAPVLGLAAGALMWFAGIWLAHDRLANRGAEVLTAAGQRTRPDEPAIPLRWDAGWYRENKATAWALLLLTAGWVPVVPQGLMVLVFDISGGWIVASHLTGGTRTAVAVAMVALGGVLLLTGLVLWGRRPRPAQS